jgi:methylenetetrahydrofolate--tRNA-(uracil-5-)-methyltransferase
VNFNIHIVGGGLAGSEAAWQLAEAGLRVRLSEMRGGGDTTPAHETDRLAEMVCSNSFRSDDAEHNAVGLLHQEMRALGSLVMRAADKHRVPAGSALAVDREAFAAEVTRAVEQHPNVTVVRERVDCLPDRPAIIATGPLTGSRLAEAIAAETGEGALAFFDAIAPIVHRDSIDMSVAWMAARWDRGSSEGGGKDYINCPLDKPRYDDFVAALVEGEKLPFNDWEKDTPY